MRVIFTIFAESYSAAGVRTSTVKDANGKTVSNPDRLTTHKVYWTELRANRLAKKYFEKHYGVDWEKMSAPDRYPTTNPFK